ncbi:hypothetical protein GCM10027265_43190 [Jatrophihabitans fulvus]
MSRFSSLSRPLATLALIAGAAGTVSVAAPAAAAPVPAQASQSTHSAYGTLVFVRHYNVWIARADGTRARALTTNGTYAAAWSTPSQADTGVVVAARRGLIYRMTPSGRVLNTIDPPPLKNSVGHWMDGTPANVAVSPDGRLIAYTHALFECPPAALCSTRFATAYTAADHLTPPQRHDITEFDSPSWIGNDRTVQGGGQLAEINLDDVDGTHRHWFRDSEIQNGWDDLSDPAVSRDGTLVATIAGWGTSKAVLWSRVNGPVRGGTTPRLPTPLCETNVEKDLAGPAFSADGHTLAWTLNGAVWMVDGPTACHQPHKVLADATQPSFSAARYSVPAPENTARPRITGLHKVGRVLHATRGNWTMRPRITYQWLRNGRPVHAATKASYHLTRRDAGARVSVRVTAHGSGGTTRRTSAAVTISRHR